MYLITVNDLNVLKHWNTQPCVATSSEKGSIFFTSTTGPVYCTKGGSGCVMSIPGMVFTKTRRPFQRSQSHQSVPCSAMQKSFMSQSPCIDVIQKHWHFSWPSWEGTALVWLENTSLSEDQSHLRKKGELESHWIGVRTKEIDQRVAANHQNPATKCFNHHTKTQSAIVCVCVSIPKTNLQKKLQLCVQVWCPRLGRNYF